MHSLSCRAGGLVAVLLLCAAPGEAGAYQVSEQLRVYGHAQMWWTLYEQMEEARELYQHPSGDEAATVTSGFSLYRARIGARTRWLDDFLELGIQLRLERDPAILDCYAAFRVADWLRIIAGQFKIPSSWETLESSRNLDFILRSRLSEYMVDYSLARTTYASSLFYGTYSYLRDFGVGLKGDVDVWVGDLRYFLMLGNGLGTGLYISGGIRKEYIITNEGQFFSGLRVELADKGGIVTLGGHLDYNRHDNIVFNSGRTVYDLDRLSYSGDLRFTIPGTGVRLAGLLGRGKIDDDYDDNGRIDVLYDGWEARLVWRLNPVLRALHDVSWLDDHLFELGARFDRFAEEWNETGSVVTDDTWTFGITWLFRKTVKLQLNVMLRRTDDPSLRDLDDDIVLLQLQGAL